MSIDLIVDSATILDVIKVKRTLTLFWKFEESNLAVLIFLSYNLEVKDVVYLNAKYFCKRKGKHLLCDDDTMLEGGKSNITDLQSSKTTCPCPVEEPLNQNF